MNNISVSRLEIKKYFDPKQIVEGSQSNSNSPTGNYRAETVGYKQNDPKRNWTVTKVRIYDIHAHDLIFEFFTDYHTFFHEWVVIGKIEYLVGAEVLCGGQTIVDLSGRKMESYCPLNEGFIWSNFHPSPSGNRLAVIGCFWACPYEVKVFDFSNPLSLPLPELTTVSLMESELDIIDWIDDHHFKTNAYDGGSTTHSVDKI